MAEAPWTPSARYPDPAIVALDPSFKRHHLALSAVERLWTGSRWGEGPVWIGDLRCLLWSDIPNNRVLKWEEETGAVSAWRRPSNNANGHTRDRQGRIIACEHAGRRVVRFESDGAVTVLQPDLSKTGGITEVQRIAAMASAWKLRVHPHTASTGLNMAATVHLLAATENAGYYEADVSHDNLFRDELVPTPLPTRPDGTVLPPEGPGLGVEVDEDFLAAHPVIEGPGFVR